MRQELLLAVVYVFLPALIIAGLAVATRPSRPRGTQLIVAVTQRTLLSIAVLVLVWLAAAPVVGSHPACAPGTPDDRCRPTCSTIYGLRVPCSAAWDKGSYGTGLLAAGLTNWLLNRRAARA